MRKRWICFTLTFCVLFVLVIFSIMENRRTAEKACMDIEEERYLLLLYGEEESGDICAEYNGEADQEMDYDWSCVSNYAGASFLAHNGKDYYARLGEYVYFCDFEGGSLVPLCDKAECRHDKEEDVLKKADCKAYVPLGAIGSGIQYHEGQLYVNSYMRLDNGEASGEYIYVLNLDGSGRRILDLQCEGAESVLFHRGSIFYISQKEGTSEFPETYEVHRYNLTDGVDKVLASLNALEGTDLDILPYGNFLYLSLYSDKSANYQIRYCLKNEKVRVWSVDKAGVLYPEKDKLWVFTFGNRLQCMDLDGNLLDGYGVLETPSWTGFSLSENIGSRSWYLSLDEEYIYQLMNSKDVTYLGIYGRNSLKLENCIPLESKLFCFSTVCYDEDKIVVADGYFDHPAVYWLERDRLKEEGVQVHTLQP